VGNPVVKSTRVNRIKRTRTMVWFVILYLILLFNSGANAGLPPPRRGVVER